MTTHQPKLVLSALIGYAMIVLYLIPYGTVSYADLSIPILAIILGLELLYHHIQINKIDVLLILLILFATLLFNVSLGRIADAFNIIILLLVCRKKQEINRNYLRALYLISLVSIIYQLSVYRYFNLPVLSIIDPNFSGFLMLLFFLFCFRNNFKIGIILALICCFIFYSRAYFLSLFIFGSIGLYQQIFNQYKTTEKSWFVFSKRFFLPTILMINILIVLLGNYLIDHVEFLDNTTERADIGRITKLTDSSNLLRFSTNKNLIDFFQKNPDYALFGIPKTYDEEQLKKALDASIPHNGFLHLVTTRGIIFALLYFLTLGRIIKRLYRPIEIKYILTVMSFSLFLHVAYSGPSLLLFVTTITITGKEKNLNEFKEESQ